MCFHSAVTAAGPSSSSPGLVVCLEIDLAAALTGRVPSSFVCCVPVLLQVCTSVALARLELDVWDCATREGSLAAQPAAQPTDEGRLVSRSGIFCDDGLASICYSGFDLVLIPSKSKHASTLLIL